MPYAKVKCRWCSRAVLVNVDQASNCPLCGHRCDCAAEKCDCPRCVSMRLLAPLPGDHDQPQVTQANGTGFRVGSLVTRVTSDGVWRRLHDADNDGLWIEVFESKGRAVDVFKALWPLLTPEERLEFLTSMNVLHVSPI